jgi:hypothetical protein
VVHYFSFDSNCKFLRSVTHILTIFDNFIEIIPNLSKIVFDTLDGFGIVFDDSLLSIDPIDVEKLSIFDGHVFVVGLFNKPLLILLQFFEHV